MATIASTTRIVTLRNGLMTFGVTWLVTFTLAVGTKGQVGQPIAAPQAQADFFEAKVRPVLAESCYGCHADGRAGGLRLDSREAMLKGGKSGRPAIVAGDPDGSPLIQAVRQTGDLKMPKDGKLRPEEIDALTQWVQGGAVWPTAAPVATQAQASVVPTAQADALEAKVRPILATNCYSCHTDERSGGLRLDSREAMLKGGRSGQPAVVPGEPDKSRMIEAVRQTGDLKMPKGGRLKAEEVEILTEWVKSGASWAAAATTVAAKAPEYIIKPEQRAFWSFQPIHKPHVPDVKNAAWPKTDIDRFVLARLEKEGLALAKPADRLSLLRRATLDLTGVPPTMEEIEAFQKDESPDAFAKVVDRLLASPRYGETWGRQWLDVARYAEDDYRSLDPMRRGFNPYPNAYLYRDWVVNAFNDDMPYDVFVKSQLAGDLVDESMRVKALPGLGFLGLGPWYYDNGAVEVTHADERNDRVDAVSRGFLGLTVGCARCHDHKYDPIPTKDYYSLAGVFLNTVYREYPLVPKAVADAFNEQDKRIEKKQSLLNEFLQTESAQVSETLALQTSAYMVAAWRVTGQPKEDMAKIAEESKVDYELLDRWVKFLAKPPKFYPYLTKWQALIKSGGTQKEAKRLAVEFQTLVLDVMFDRKEIKEENDIIAAKALPGTKKKEKGKLPSDFVTNDDFCPGCGLELKTLPIERMNLWTDVFQRDLQEGADPAQMQGRGKPGLLVFRGWALERQLSAERLRYVDGLRSDIAAARKTQPPHFPYLHAVADEAKPQNLKQAIRGNAFNLGAEIPRHFLSVLSDGPPQPFQQGSGRLELAEAILQQPLTMRVIVNRIWKGHFGTGIVDTPSNFGVMGDRPAHPELLDYLAQFFVDNGLSFKKLQKEILLSAVYQLSTDEDSKNYEKDPDNRLYWRANRHRMTVEQIRDSLLAVSGALDAKMGGPSEVLTPASTRRTLYGKVSRYSLDSYLQLFDFPSPALSAEKRFTTTVPLQRLFFMNSDFVQQQAELLARRITPEPNNQARIEKAYQLIFGRAPTVAEVSAGLSYLTAEPLKAYDERKTAQTAKHAATAQKKASEGTEGKGAISEPPDVATANASPADEDSAEDAPVEDLPQDDMMAGVLPRPERKGTDEKKLVAVTLWGRYVKVLLSSGEFLFVN